MLLLLFIAASASLQAQEEEEVIISSENIEEAEKVRTRFKVKPRYRYVDSTQQRTLIKIAFQPEYSKFPGRFDLNAPRARGLGSSIVLGYEHLLKNYQFSLFIDNSTRLYAPSEAGFDYQSKFRFQDSRGNNLNRGGEFDTHLSSFDIGAKFYYRQRKKVEYGASGVNPFSEYVFFRIKDVLSFAQRTTIIRSINSGLLEREVKERRWIANPGYVMMGWGTQRRIYDRLLTDFYVGVGVKIAGTRDHANRSAIINVGLNIGLGLGRRN